MSAREIEIPAIDATLAKSAAISLAIAVVMRPPPAQMVSVALQFVLVTPSPCRFQPREGAGAGAELVGLDAEALEHRHVEVRERRAALRPAPQGAGPLGPPP